MTPSEQSFASASQLALTDPVLVNSYRMEEIIIDHTLDLLAGLSTDQVNQAASRSAQEELIEDAETWAMSVVNQGSITCIAYMIELEGLEPTKLRLEQFKQADEIPTLSESF